MLKRVLGGPSRALGKRSEESRSSALQTREQIYPSGFGQPEPDHHKARLELQGQRLGEPTPRGQGPAGRVELTFPQGALG